MANELSQSNLWLLIDASQEGVVRFATAVPSEAPELLGIRSMTVEGVPTFTDALQRFERESGISLRGTPCVMAVAGATTGETLSLVRSRWTIARSGLSAVFDRPVTIINDVAARAWAVKFRKVQATALVGGGSPQFRHDGCYVMVNIDEGVGAAVVDVDREQRIRILETEAGHADFGPANEQEEKLAKAVRGGAPVVSWEMMLALDLQSPVWAQACPGLTEPEKLGILARILARFSVNLMHVFGAWNGVMITGARGAWTLQENNRFAFQEAFRERRKFSRLVSTCPVWLVEPQEAVLRGAAQCLAEQQGYSRPKAA